MKRRLAIGSLMIAGAVSSFSALRFLTQDSKDFVIRSDVRLVLLDVAVRERNGGLVGNLTKDNFTVLENGQPQQLTSFSNEDVPVTIGLLMDESRSMSSKRNGVLAAAGDFIRTCNRSDEFFVLNFNDTVKRGLPEDQMFSDDMGQLRAALYRGRPRGMTALNDAVVDGLDQLTLGRQERKALVIVSDGGDNASQHTRAEMVNMVERSPATIYSVTLIDPNDPDYNPQLLKQLARISGGEAFFLETPDKLREVCEGIGKEIRNRYTMGYTPAPGKSGELRRIQVRVSVPGRNGLVARTRTSYLYGDAPNAESK